MDEGEEKKRMAGLWRGELRGNIYVYDGIGKVC